MMRDERGDALIVTHSELCAGLGSCKAYGGCSGGEVETEAAIFIPVGEHLKSVVERAA